MHYVISFNYALFLMKKIQCGALVAS